MLVFKSMSFLNDLLAFFEEHSVSGVLAIMPQAKYLLVVLAIIDLCTTWTIYDGNVPLSKICDRIIKIGLLTFLLTYYSQIMSAILQSFQYAGLTGAGISVTDKMLSPSGLVDMGFKTCRKLLKSMNFISILFLGGFPKLIVFILCIIFTLTACYLMAFQVLLTKIEFNIFATVAVILIPFGALKFTNFLFQRVIYAVFNFGIKLMITHFMIGLVTGYMSTVEFSTGSSFTILLQQAISMFILGLLIWKVPQLASNIMFGQGTLEATGIVTTVVSTAGAVVTGGASAAGAGATAAAAKAGANGTTGIFQGGQGTLGNYYRSFPSAGRQIFGGANYFPGQEDVDDD